MRNQKDQCILSQKLFQMLCRELKQYERRGISLLLGEKPADAVQIAEQCAIFHPGEYMGQIRRDKQGNILEIWFVRADRFSFEKNGRFLKESPAEVQRKRTKQFDEINRKGYGIHL